MKIMFALTVYEIGGASTVARNLMDAFAADGHDIVLLTENIASGHYPLGSRVKSVDLDVSPKNGLMAKISNAVNNIISLRRHIARETPDAILGFGAYINCRILLSLLP